MARGDHIKVERSGYWHHGIDVGNNEVVHYKEAEAGTGMSRFMNYLTKKSAEVTKTSMKEFLKGGKAIKGGLRNTTEPLENDHIAKRAESAIGDPAHYNLVFNNCEHFANWCETGEAVSHQVNTVAKKLAIGAAKAAGAVAAGMIAKKFGVRITPKLKT